MPRIHSFAREWIASLVIVLIGATSEAQAQRIDPANDGSRYAWGENVGWINLQPAFGPGVTVTDTAMTGLAWGENIGWINLSPASFGGVVNDGAGRLSGYAWGENVGWINFAPAGGGVFIDACGEFNGAAYGENIGWISFRSNGPFPFRVKTSWVTPTDRTPPVTSASGAGPNWSRTDVAVTLTATDCGASVREIRYTLDNDPEVVTHGASVTVTISSEGTHSLRYYAVDDGGNLETPSVLTVRIDKSEPIVTLSSPLNGAVYVVNQNVAADFDVADSVSGVAGVVATAADGSAVDTATTGVKTFVVTALDHAGNSTSVTHTYSVVLPPPPGPRIITTFAGGGTVYGDGGPATAAALSAPHGIDFDAAGNLYIVDNGDHVVRRRDAATGVITTVAGTPGVFGDCFGGGCGNGGPATAAALAAPFGIAVDASRNLYIADTLNYAVRKVDAATGVIRSIAGNFPGLCDGNGGPAHLASLGLPLDVAVDGVGNVYIADAGCWAIRRIDAATGIINNFAGSLPNTEANGGVGGGDGGPARDAAFTGIVSLSIDHLGNLYVVDGYPGTDYMGSIVRKIDAQTGIITRVAGGGTGSGESGPATDAQIGFVHEVAVDAAGNMYLAGDFRVWRVDPTGAISRVAGFGSLTGEGIAALTAAVGAVSGIAMAANGDVLISDSPRVRRISAAGSGDDTTAPVIANVPPDIAAEATSPSGAIVVYAAPTAFDDRNGAVAVTCAPASGTVFPLGVTSVTCTAADAAGNMASAAFSVTVADTTPPVIALLSPAAGASFYVGQNVAAAFAVADTVSGVASVSSTAPSGGPIDTAAAGNKAFTVTAFDRAGNAATVTHAYIVVTDVLGDVNITGTNSPEILIALQSVTGDVIVGDNDAAASIAVQIPRVIGTNIVITDNSSATSINASVGGLVGGDLNIVDNGNAAINVDTPRIAGDVTISTGGTTVAATTGDGTTKVTFANSPATMTVRLPAGSFTSGVRFSIHSLGAQPPGEGFDAEANAYTIEPLAAYQFAFGIPTLNSDATLTFDVNLAALDDQAAAEFSNALASNSATLAVRGDAAGSAYQIFAICAGQLPSAGGCVDVTRFDANGAPIAPGDPSAPAAVRFTGIIGHFSTYALVIATPILDTIAPVISGTPADIIAEATSRDGASVEYALPTAEDDRDGPVAVSCLPGSVFPMGITTVRCTATDRAANTAEAIFRVTVVDTTPPVLTVPPDVVVTASGVLTPVAIGMATATDIFGATVTHDAPASFPIGVTSVTWTAVDGNGNRISAMQKVDVIYLFKGFTGPIAPGGTYRANRTLPLMFELSFADGASATAAIAALRVVRVGADSTLGTPIDIDANGPADGGNLFRYTGNHYQFNLSTWGWSAGTYRIAITLDDGRTYTMDVTLR